MAEPTSAGVGVGAGAASLSGAMVVMLGPVIGPWVAVLLTAVIGAAWTVGRVATDSRLVASLLMIRTVFTALVLTGFTAASLTYLWAAAPLDHLAPGISFCLAAIGDKFDELREALARRLKNLISGDRA